MNANKKYRILKNRSQRGSVIFLLLIFAIPVIALAYAGLVVDPGLKLVKQRMDQHQADADALSLRWECQQIFECRDASISSAPSVWSESFASASKAVIEELTLAVFQMLTMTQDIQAQGNGCSPPDCIQIQGQRTLDNGNVYIEVERADGSLAAFSRATIPNQSGGANEAPTEPPEQEPEEIVLCGCIQATNAHDPQTIRLGKDSGGGAAKGKKGSDEKEVFLKSIGCNIVVNSDKRNSLLVKKNSLLQAVDADILMAAPGGTGNDKKVVKPEPITNQHNLCNPTSQFNVNFDDSCLESDYSPAHNEFLAPGKYCGNVSIDNASVTFPGGTYYIQGDLRIGVNRAATVRFKPGVYYIGGDFLTSGSTIQLESEYGDASGEYYFFIDGYFELTDSNWSSNTNAGMEGFAGALVAGKIHIEDRVDLVVRQGVNPPVHESQDLGDNDEGEIGGTKRTKPTTVE